MSEEERVAHSLFIRKLNVGYMTAMAPHSTNIIKQKKIQPHSQFRSVMF